MVALIRARMRAEQVRLPFAIAEAEPGRMAWTCVSVCESRKRGNAELSAPLR